MLLRWLNRLKYEQQSAPKGALLPEVPNFLIPAIIRGNYSSLRM